MPTSLMPTFAGTILANITTDYTSGNASKGTVRPFGDFLSSSNNMSSTLQATGNNFIARLEVGGVVRQPIITAGLNYTVNTLFGVGISWSIASTDAWQKARTATTLGSDPAVWTVDQFSIGSGGTGAVTKLGGTVGDLKVYKSARTQAEIDADLL